MESQPNDGLIGKAVWDYRAEPLFLRVHLSRHEESGSSVCIFSISNFYDKKLSNLRC